MTDNTLESLRNSEPSKQVAVAARPLPLPLAEIAKNPELIMLDPGTFEHMQRIGKMLASSQLVPKHFQNKDADCAIAVQMAIALHCQPMQVLQNMFVIHGTPGFSSKFAIALANQRGPFIDGIHFKETAHEKSNDLFAVTAYGTLRSSGRIVERSVSLATAKAEGWYKNNTKYKSIPDQMLAYRAAMFLIRLYCPEVLFGMASADELLDIGKAGHVEEKIMSYGDGVTIEAEAETEAVAVEEVVQQVDTQTAKKEAPKVDEKKKPDEVVQSGPTFLDVVNMIRNADLTDQEDVDAIESLISSFDADNKVKLSNLLHERMPFPAQKTIE